MTYIIKTYEKDFLIKQFEIGNSILTHWPGTNQTSVDVLIDLYNRDNFDPETKLYAFMGDEMIGFMTATIKPLKEGETIKRANMEFPIVLEGHKEAEKLLFNRMIETLKAKGVSKVQSRAHVEWGNTMAWVKNEKYQKKRILNISANIPIERCNFEPGLIIARNYDESTDLEAVKKMYIDNGILNEKQLDTQLKFLRDNPDRIVTWNVYIENGEVLGNSVLTTLGNDNFSAAMGNITALSDKADDIRRSILCKNVKDCKDKGMKELQLFLFGQYLEFQKKYEEIGVKFNPELALYHKDI